MRVIGQSPDPLSSLRTMTKRQGKSGTIDIKAVLAEDEEFLRALVRIALQEVLEAEMTEALGAEKGERASGRQGYRSGYYGRTLIQRTGSPLEVLLDFLGLGVSCFGGPIATSPGTWCNRYVSCEDRREYNTHRS